MLPCGYDIRLATGAVAAGTFGIMIPPSMGMIVYAVTTETSFGKLFAAGIIPGIRAVTIYAATATTWTRINLSLAPKSEKKPLGERLLALREVRGILLLFAAVMGGISWA
jgi:TRAP-type C4-dicarboxylate transport system permease large subunit